MREIDASVITGAVKNLCMDANYYLGEDVVRRLQECEKKEESPTGKEVLNKILENAQIAESDQVPLCQDTGFAVFFVELGQEVHIVGGDFVEAVNEGVRQGYKEGYLRKSIVSDPIERKNTGDNTPAVIYTDIVQGDGVKIIIAPKGGGSENMSEVKMLAPAAGIEGVKGFVIDKVLRSGANPCPPVVVGVGIGGTFDKCAQIAKRALLRPVGSKHPNPFYAELEEELLERINRLGIGPQGFGGRCTALAVHVEVHPCHIASFPVAVNMQCHVARHKEVVL
jgi:fumarate hydratase subunit alpha